MSKLKLLSYYYLLKNQELNYLKTIAIYKYYNNMRYSTGKKFENMYLQKNKNNKYR